MNLPFTVVMAARRRRLRRDPPSPSQPRTVIVDGSSGQPFVVNGTYALTGDVWRSPSGHTLALSGGDAVITHTTGGGGYRAPADSIYDVEGQNAWTLYFGSGAAGTVQLTLHIQE